MELGESNYCNTVKQQQWQMDQCGLSKNSTDTKSWMEATKNYQHSPKYYQHLASRITLDMSANNGNHLHQSQIHIKSKDTKSSIITQTNTVPNNLKTKTHYFFLKEQVPASQ